MKYITKKVIKGNAYFYFQYKNYSKLIGKYLPKENLHGDLLDFFIEISKKEYALLSEEVKKKFKYGSLELLEKMHHGYIAIESELFGELKRDFHIGFIKMFTYHSNQQEGSKTTKEQIEKFSKSTIRKPKTYTEKELMGSFEAFQYAISDKMEWNMKNIKHIHKILLSELQPVIAGKWKMENNVAPGNQLTTDHKKVQEEMKSLIAWLKKEFRKKTYPPEIALKFYCKFEKIHPFLDGNGRVGRILLNAILHKFKYPFIVFFKENKQEHSSAIQQALEGRWEKTYKHFLKQVQKTNTELTLYSQIKE